MNESNQFQYGLFRQHIIHQLQQGLYKPADITALLEPVIQDILAGFCQQTPTLNAESTGERGLSGKVADKSSEVGRPNRHSRRPNSLPIIPVNRVEQDVLAWYEAGNSYQKIQERLYFTYRKEIAIGDLCRLTDQIIPRLSAWGQRPLQALYAYLWVSQIQTQLWQQDVLLELTMHTVIGIDLQGRRDILGYYLYKPASTEFWSALTDDLTKRGVKDLLIVCVEQPELAKRMLSPVYPLANVHGCISQQMRRSLQQITTQEKASVRKALKAVYQAPDLIHARQIWQQVQQTWGTRYPLLIESWEHNWEGLLSLMSYPKAVRQLAQGIPLLTDCYSLLRQASQMVGQQTTEVECMKALFVLGRYKLTTQQPIIGGWGLILQELASVFEQRVKNVLRGAST